MNADDLRIGLGKVIALGKFVVILTPTALDDKALTLLDTLVKTPGLLEAVLDLFEKKGVKFE